MDADATPRIPQPLDSWEELNRRCADHSQNALAQLADAQKKLADLEARVTALENA